jgi:hypothetical protein
LTEDPTYGTVALAATAPVTLTFDASVPEVTQPGDYYATLTFEDGVVEVEMPVTMTVEPPATWGKIGGLVQGLGYCNVMTTPLEGAVIFVESTVTTDTWAVKPTPPVCTGSGSTKCTALSTLPSPTRPVTASRSSPV